MRSASNEADRALVGSADPGAGTASLLRFRATKVRVQFADYLGDDTLERLQRTAFRPDAADDYLGFLDIQFDDTLHDFTPVLRPDDGLRQVHSKFEDS